MKKDGPGEERQQKTEFDVRKDISLEHAPVARCTAHVIDSERAHNDRQRTRRSARGRHWTREMMTSLSLPCLRQ